MERLKTLKEIREEMVLKYLDHFEGNRTKAASAMGISIRTLRNYIHEMRDRGVNISLGNTHPNSRLGASLVSSPVVSGLPSNKERLFHADNPEMSFDRHRKLVN